MTVDENYPYYFDLHSQEIISRGDPEPQRVTIKGVDCSGKYVEETLITDGINPVKTKTVFASIVPIPTVEPIGGDK